MLLERKKGVSGGQIRLGVLTKIVLSKFYKSGIKTRSD